jgi:hypothetical protein
MSDDRDAPPARPFAALQADDLLDAVIERWWTDHFPGSAVARNTAAWNVAHAAKEAMKRLPVRVRKPLPETAAENDFQGSI